MSWYTVIAIEQGFAAYSSTFVARLGCGIGMTSKLPATAHKVVQVGLCMKAPPPSEEMDWDLPSWASALASRGSGQSARRNHCDEGHNETRQHIHKVVPAFRRHRCHHR